MKKLLLLTSITILIIGCQGQQPQPSNCSNDTAPPQIIFEGDTTSGNPGTVINFTTTATDDHNVKLVEVYGKITYSDGGSMLQTEDIPAIYTDSTTQGTTVNGSCSYTVPATVGGHALGTSSYDYLEFWGRVEDCHGDATSNFTFNVYQ